MVEKFLVDLIQRVKKNEIAIILSGDFVDSELLEFLPKLKNKLKTVGDIKVATVIYANKLPESHFDPLRKAGFSHKIAHSFLELNYLIEVYDLYLREEIDIIILGTKSEMLIPLFTEIRQKNTIYGLTKGNLPVSIVESFDGMININAIEDFEFVEKKIPDFAMEGSDYSDEDNDDFIDITNIGTTSSKIVLEDK